MGIRTLDPVESSQQVLQDLVATNHSISFARQPILADEVQTFKALITVHKVLQEGHPIAVKEAQPNTIWLESLTRGVSGEGIRGRCDQDEARSSEHMSTRYRWWS